jgi:hypothetical protein
MPDYDAFADRERALEAEYIIRRDHELVEKMRQARLSQHARVEMSRQTGLDDPDVIKELQELGFTPETIVLLPFIPLLEVAWVDGVRPAERDLLVKLARRRHIEEGSVADRQLAEWMVRRPAPVVFERAGRLISALLASGSAELREGLTADQLVAYCEQIAAASGGLLGTRILSISNEERVLLSRIASELHARKR